ncbi:MAG: hypothetical protein J1E62_01930 [Lachnospiraceae bacterium]|nr:hypothetical protein [Lachnospiraceae bacterium]
MVIDLNYTMDCHNCFYNAKKAEEESNLSDSGYKEHSEPDKISNFKEICEMFPGVSFVVIGDRYNPLGEYEGICKTGSFSYLGTPSIILNEEILERFHASEEDNKNIIAIIGTLTRNYSYWGVSYAKLGDSVNPNGCSYLAIDIHYHKDGYLTFSEICTNDGPFFENELNKSSFKRMEEYMEIFKNNYLLKYIAERDIEDALFGEPSLKESSLKDEKDYFKQFLY